MPPEDNVYNYKGYQITIRYSVVTYEYYWTVSKEVDYSYSRLAEVDEDHPEYIPRLVAFLTLRNLSYCWRITQHKLNHNRVEVSTPVSNQYNLTEFGLDRMEILPDFSEA